LNQPRQFRAAAAALVSAALAGAVLAGCGGGSSKTAATTPPTTAGSAGRPQAAAFQGASGTVAAISGSSMEVQDPSSGQTTVNWTASTVFSEVTKVTSSALTPGRCATVTGTSSGSTITARSVVITNPTSSGTCTRGFGAGGRRVAPTGGTTRRSFPAGTGRSRFAGGSVASGKVLSVSGTTLVIDGVSFTFGSAGATSPGTPPTTVPTRSIDITLSPSTTYTETLPAAASNLAVGDCVVATGPADTTGAVTARSVRITSTGGQSCTAGGFGGFFGRAGGGAGSGGGTGGSVQ
jgi:hypothetical protein